MEFKITNDDFVEYNIYPLPENLSEAELAEFREKCLQVLAPYVVNYLWHLDSFNLQVVAGRTKSRPHLRGRVHFGDNIEDEWFVVSLILRLTSSVDAVATLRDADGEVLLIEAADKLPQWAQEPEISDGRVFVYRGEVHLIPVARSPAELTPIPSSLRPEVDDAVSTIVKFSEITRASAAVQSAIRLRCKKYPEDWSEEQHHARVTVPASVRYIIKKYPQTVAAAVRAFYSRDDLDIRACRLMKHFPPNQNLVKVRARFSRCLYAMLSKPRFFPDKKSNWNIPLESDPQHKSAMLGMKLTCGYEMLAAQASKRSSANPDSVHSSDPKFRFFIEKLQENGYFQGELEGSNNYNFLLDQAKQFYASSDESDEGFRFSSQILKMSQNYRLDSSEDVDENDLAASDDESWLDVEPESFDALLRQHFKLEAEQSESSKTEPALPSEIKRFLQSLSEFDGVQISHKNTDDMINMDPDLFGEALNKALNIAANNEDDDSSSDEDDVIDLDHETVSQSMTSYFGQMRNELRGTKVETEGDEAEWSRPLDVDGKLLTNLLESYRSQEGAAGPTTTLLEPLGLKLDKK